MSARARKVMVLAGGLGLGALYLWGVLGLPPAGEYRGPYGIVLNQVAVSERHATDVVSAVNFDYRAIDTLGEEFILFSSVVGVALLLRKHKDEKEEEKEAEEGGSRGTIRRRIAPRTAIRLRPAMRFERSGWGWWASTWCLVSTSSPTGRSHQGEASREE